VAAEQRQRALHHELVPGIDCVPLADYYDCCCAHKAAECEAFTMEFLVTMTTQVPGGTTAEKVDAIRAREAARSRELAEQGHLLRLWRPPLQPGEWRTLGLFAADGPDQLEEVLASMPLRVWRTDEVIPLSPHPNDPAQTSG
jgi:muconolactone D-isomerase